MRLGLLSRDSIIDIVRLENSLRAELNKVATEFSGLNPLKVVITNYPEDVTETLKLLTILKIQMLEIEIYHFQELYTLKEMILWKIHQKVFSSQTWRRD